MKVVIYIACVFVIALIQTLLRSAGILLGGIPTALLYVGMFWVARRLTKLVDKDK